MTIKSSVISAGFIVLPHRINTIGISGAVLIIIGQGNIIQLVRRLSIKGATGKMIRYKTNDAVDIDRLVFLFDEAGWPKKAADRERLCHMIKNTDLIVTAWDDESMIGFARCTTDHVFNGQINNVVVDAKYRKRGIGSHLVTMIIESNPKVTYMLRTEDENESFYKKMGFKTADRALIYERKE